MKQRINIISIFTLGYFIFSCGTAIAAGLTGSTVFGVANFSGLPYNYFGPHNGFITSGYSAFGNSNSSDVVIGSGIEFGVVSPSNTDSVDFSASEIIFTDFTHAGSGLGVFTFTDVAFMGLTITQISNNFPNLTATLSGNLLTLTLGTFTVGGHDPASQTATEIAIYNISAVPEPGSELIVLSSIATLLIARRFCWQKDWTLPWRGAADWEGGGLAGK